MWIDGVILAPLLLWAEEKLVSDRKWLPMFWILWCSFVTNYYIGYMLSIFACLYFVFLFLNYLAFQFCILIFSLLSAIPP